MSALEQADQSWTAQAACAGRAPDELFVQGAAQRQVREVCFGCPVRTECLADALDSRAQFGVWGGLTERERRALLRRAGEITWTTALADVPSQRLSEELQRRWPMRRR